VATLLVALKINLEIDGSDARARNQAIQQVESLTTIAEAQDYIGGVLALTPPASATAQLWNTVR
jgi:hypothetical protein